MYTVFVCLRAMVIERGGGSESERYCTHIQYVLPDWGWVVQGSWSVVEEFERVRDEERDWPSRHGPSSRSCVDREMCGTDISALMGNSCNYTRQSD